jgi:hypothetical protein
MTALAYGDIDALVRSIWTAGWTHVDVPTFWRAQEVGVLPDPRITPHFMRNELTYGRESTIAFGGGRFANQKLKYGSVVLRVFSDTNLANDTVALGLLSDAEAVYRSLRTGAISFIGGMSGFDENDADEPLMDAGNWTMRGSLIVWQYRFTG